MSKDKTGKQAAPEPIPVYVAHEYNRLDHDTTFLGVASSLETAQQYCTDQLLTTPAAEEWSTSCSMTTGEVVSWNLREAGCTYTVSKLTLMFTDDVDWRASVLAMAAYILTEEFGPITVEQEVKVLTRVAAQLRPDPEGEQAQEDASWQG